MVCMINSDETLAECGLITGDTEVFTESVQATPIVWSISKSILTINCYVFVTMPA